MLSLLHDLHDVCVCVSLRILLSQNLVQQQQAAGRDESGSHGVTGERPQTAQARARLPALCLDTSTKADSRDVHVRNVHEILTSIEYKLFYLRKQETSRVSG